MWKKHFSEKILKEGLLYFKEGTVVDFNYSSNNVIARVLDYNVCINFENRDVSSMYCDCRVKSCQHQAAALYYFDNTIQKDYSKLISSFTHEELIDFLKKELPGNPDIVNEMKLYKGWELDCDFYQNKLKNSFDSYVKVINFIKVDLEKLKTNNHIDLLLILLNDIVEYLDELNDAGMYDEYDIILRMIGELLNNLIDLNYIKEVSGFLKHFILNSEDETVSDYFSYIYSRIGDAEKLFD